MKERNYSISPFTIEMKMAADGAYMNKYVRLMNTFFELDITQLRQSVKKAKREKGLSVSVLACLMYGYARALDKNKETLAMRGRGSKLYAFEDADLFFPVRIKTTDNKRLLWCKIIRAANRKTVQELDEAIKQATTMTKKITQAERIFFKLPNRIRYWFYDYMMGNPLMRKANGGNVYFSSLMQAGIGNLWYGIPSHFHSTGMFIGMYKEVADTPDSTEKRSILGVSCSLDHVISDGATLAKIYKDFASEINQLVL